MKERKIEKKLHGEGIPSPAVESRARPPASVRCHSCPARESAIVVVVLVRRHRCGAPTRRVWRPRSVLVRSWWPSWKGEEVWCTQVSEVVQARVWTRASDRVSRSGTWLHKRKDGR